MDLSLEAEASGAIVGQFWGDHFHGDQALQGWLPGQVDACHGPLPQESNDLEPGRQLAPEPCLERFLHLQSKLLR